MPSALTRPFGSGPKKSTGAFPKSRMFEMRGTLVGSAMSITWSRGAFVLFHSLTFL